MNNRLLDDDHDDDDSLLTPGLNNQQQQQAFSKSTNPNSTSSLHHDDDDVSDDEYLPHNSLLLNNNNTNQIDNDNNNTTQQASATGKGRKWWNLKKDRKSHAVCWMMVLGSGLLLTAIGIVSMVLLVIYSPTPKEILNGTSPISEKQWKEIVLETFGVVSGFVIGIGIVLSITPLICSCYIMNPKEFQIPGIHTDDDEDEDDGL